jgi:2-desacetyl-2-hydroxyethyl bacteriochlorophyllide A dehydrogenase
MKVIRLEEPGRFSLQLAEDPPIASIQPDEALVRVHRIGVCGTDIHAFNGRQPFFNYPRVLGHELGVEIVAVGHSTQNVKPGDLCSIQPYFDCHRCIACRRGKPNCCVNLRVLGVHVDGGMCEMLIIPSDNLHPSEKLLPDQLAMVETLGIGCHAVKRARLEARETVLVIGVGPIGLGVAHFAIRAGTQLIVLDVDRRRLEFCHDQMGVVHLIDGSRENPLAALERITHGDLPTTVFDATGNPDSMTEAFQYSAHGGQLIFVGLFPGDITFNDPNFHRRELTVSASRNALSEDFTTVINLLETGMIDTMPWITHRARLGEVLKEFPSWTKSAAGVVKAMIEI